MYPPPDRSNPPHTSRRRVGRTAVWSILSAVALASCFSRPPVAPSPPPRPPEVAVPGPTPGARTFVATAYSIEGTTASGTTTHPGIVAADPAVLPIGSRIRVTDAGSYSGTYTVADTGRAIKGNTIDVFIPDAAEARRFGRRDVKVEVLQRGH
jgi:3D (Asp-Asp-Asp) domain-containing protein